MKKRISDRQFIQAYRSAGLWFVALYMEAFILRMDELQDEVKKTYLIAEIFNNGNGPDKNERSTRTRLDCLFRIIESDRITEVLEIASTSSKIDPQAAKTAHELLRKIKAKIFVLPKERSVSL
jgi:hypothetical protein